MVLISSPEPAELLPDGKGGGDFRQCALCLAFYWPASWPALLFLLVSSIGAASSTRRISARCGYSSLKQCKQVLADKARDKKNASKSIVCLPDPANG
jgi:hypothetical protein